MAKQVMVLQGTTRTTWYYLVLRGTTGTIPYAARTLPSNDIKHLA
jgi:hypothetical protein